MDLTQRLLSLGRPERELLVDLYQARFADPTLLSRLRELSGGEDAALRTRGLLRDAAGPDGKTHYLTATGQRAALSLLPPVQSGGRAYAALRLSHELLRAELYVALRRRGMPATAYRAEPRLPYRSAAGLGERTLVPDAFVEAESAWLVEVDRGTERLAELRHKWLRYQEWQLGAGDGGRIAVLAAGESTAVERSLAATGLAAVIFRSVDALAETIWSGEEPL